jgi:hypothetical protein
MDISIPAKNVLTATVMSGSVEIDTEKIVWANDHQINFEYKKSGYGNSSGGTENFEVEMRINAQLANGAHNNYDLGAGNKHLDGGNIGTDRSGIQGVGQNADDFIWRFSRE